MAWQEFGKIWRRWRTLAGHWLRFAAKDATSAAFGWAAVPSGAVLLLALRYWGFRESPHPEFTDLLLYACAGAGAGWMIAFLWNAIFMAPSKARFAINPLCLIVRDQVSNPTMVQSVIEKHVVSITIKNRSPVGSLYCTVSISEIKGKAGVSLPWQIYSANIPANDEHQVPIAQWFFWELERENNDISILNERPGTFLSATMVQLPQSGAELCVSARSPDHPETRSWCRVWVEHHRLAIKRIETPAH